jgi:hypothetical protein
MRISHRELEVCGRDPGAWVRARLAPAPGGPRQGYDSVLKFGLHRLHLGQSIEEARRHIEQIFARSERLRNGSRIEDVLDRLERYAEWLQRSGTAVADSMARIELGGFGLLELSGIVDRVDVTESGHRGVLLGRTDGDWQAELRMPLLQSALADRYGVPVEEVAVGVQQLDGSELALRTFMDGEVLRAEHDLRQLSERVQRMYTELRGRPG